MTTMQLFNRVRLGLAVMVGAGVLWGVGVANASIVWTGSYDPSLGTLPSDQGWTVDSSGSPPPAVVGGVLHQGPTGDYQYWERNDVVTDFSTPAGLAVEFTLHIASSTSGEGGDGVSWRAGYMAYFADQEGRFVGLGITAAGVRVSNHGSWLYSASSPWISVDTTSQFNTYLLTADASGVALSINGIPIPAASLPSGSTGVAIANRWWFADGTYAASNESDLQRLRWGSLSTPGEATDLRVTGHDAITGDLELSYAPACASESHDLHYGPLDQVATYGWSGSTCGIGSTGEYAGFNPGLDSYFFVVVGNAGAVEGPYGADSLGTPRPAVGTAYCGREQALATACP